MKLQKINRNEKITWADWLKKQDENENSSYFNQPSWLGFTKGNNPYDFSNIEIKGIDINRAVAEGLTMRNASLENINFEEGDFSRANFSNSTFLNCRFNKTILTNANFSGATFKNCNLNRVNLVNADFSVKEITETVIYGIAAWDLKISDDSIQSKLIIEKTYQLYSEIIEEGRIPLMVDDIELAQFIHYLSNHKKLRDTINILNNRGVLLLGRFKDGGIKRLYEIKDWLIKQNYLPMIFDFDRPEGMDYTETIVSMGALSKIVIADLSGSSVPQELHAILSTFIKPIIVYHTDKPYSMLKDLKRKNRYFHQIKFDGTFNNLKGELAAKLKNAESDYKEILVDLAEEYN